MKKGIVLCFLCMLSLLLSTATSYAGEDADEIIRIEESEEKDIVSTFYVADDVLLPLKMNLKGAEGTLMVVIDHNGQSYVIDSGRYKVISAFDGKGRLLSSGATLVIRRYDSQYYLDFNKPMDGIEACLDWKGFIMINIVFAIVVYIAAKLFKKYRKSIVG